MSTSMRPIGEHLREWRQRRRLSQLDLAGEAEISTRHLSFLETGRSAPSREMVLHLAEHLDVPLRARNQLLVAAGYAPVFRERSLDDPALEAARKAIDLILAGHEPYPALAVDRHWTMLSHNAVLPHLFAGLDPALLSSPVNVLRLSLHPKGLAPRILNLAEWRAHLFARLRRQIDATGDPVLANLMEELRDYPEPAEPKPTLEDPGSVAVPLRLRLGQATLSFISTTTLFGTPLDVTVSEIALETFFPADAETGEILRGLTAAS